MAISIAAGFMYILNEGKRKGLSEDFLYNVGMGSVFFGFVGARLVYVLTNLPSYLENPIEIIRIDHGGISIHGGIVVGVLFAWWYAKRNGYHLLPLMDWGVPGIALGVALVRIGNIFNQEILGYTAGILDGARHPVQLYGSAIGVVMLIIFALQTRRDPQPPYGYRFWTAVFVYSLLRFVEEAFRAENPHFLVDFMNPHWGVGGITLTQWLTPLFLIGALIGMQYAYRVASRGLHIDKDASTASSKRK